MKISEDLWFLNKSIESLTFEYCSYTAAAVMEMDFERIDINQCPKGQGNDSPNRFSDTARCKETTEVSSFTLILTESWYWLISKSVDIVKV